MTTEEHPPSSRGTDAWDPPAGRSRSAMPGGNTSEASIEFAYAWRTVTNRWRTLVSVPLALLLLASLKGSTARMVYRATARVQISTTGTDSTTPVRTPKTGDPGGEVHFRTLLAMVPTLASRTAAHLAKEGCAVTADQVGRRLTLGREEPQIITVSVDDTEPRRAALIANTFTNCYIHERTVAVRVQAAQRRRLLEVQARRLQRELDRAQSWVSALRQRHHLEELPWELQSPVQPTPAASAVAAEITALKQRYAGTPARDTSARAALRTRLADLALRQSTGAPPPLVAGQTPTTRRAPNSGAVLAQLARLQNTRDVLEKTYLGILEQQYQATADESGIAGPINLVHPALPTAAPRFPRRLLLLAVAGALGLVLGAALAFIQESMDGAISDADALAKETGIPVLACVQVTRSPLSGFRASRHPAQQALLADDIWRLFAALRSRIQGDLPCALAMTSDVEAPAQGVIGAHLAVAMARAGHRTIIVDVNMGNPTLHQTFGLRNGAGLAGLLDRESTLSDVLLQTRVKGLCLLPAGRTNETPAALLASLQPANIIRTLKREADFILLDTPEALCRADASLLLPEADAVLLIVYLRRSTHRGVAQVIRVSEAAGSRVVGLVLCRTRARWRYGRRRGVAGSPLPAGSHLDAGSRQDQPAESVGSGGAGSFKRPT